MTNIFTYVKIWERNWDRVAPNNINYYQKTRD